MLPLDSEPEVASTALFQEPQAGGRRLRRLHRHVPEQRDPDEAHVEGLSWRFHLVS